MFTPEGYWSWTETVEAVSDWTLEIVAASLAPELTEEQLEESPSKCRQVLHKRLVSSRQVENLKEAQFAMGLLELWILANYMDTFDAVLCSPDCKILRCPPLIKAHGDAFDWWVWPLSKEKISNGEAHGYFKAFRNGIFSIVDAQARFCTIDYDTGTVRLKPNTVSLLNTASYGFNQEEGETQRFIDEQIRPIVGWSICWNENEIPETRKDLFDSLGFSDLQWDTLGKSEAKRKSTTSTFECVMAAFPDGKGYATWSEVEAKVGYSRRSILRALKQNGLHSKWAKTGQGQ